LARSGRAFAYPSEKSDDGDAAYGFPAQHDIDIAVAEIETSGGAALRPGRIAAASFAKSLPNAPASVT
jgi:hypothetical protein